MIHQHVREGRDRLAAEDIRSAPWEGVVEECSDLGGVAGSVRGCCDEERVLRADVAGEGFEEGAFADAALAEDDGFDAREGGHQGCD